MHLQSNINVRYIYKICIVTIKYIHALINNWYKITHLPILEADTPIPLPPKLEASVAPPWNLDASVPP